jgi:TonB family protein
MLAAEMPHYLALARTGNIQGKVEIQVVTDAEGRVISAQQKSGHPLLAYSALENVKTWRFAGQSERTITYEFKIEGSASPNDNYYRYGKIVFHLPNSVEVIVPPLVVEP